MTDPATSWDGLPLVLRVPDVARVLDCSADVVYEAIRRGDLPARRVGGNTLRVSRAALQQYVEQPPAAVAGTNDAWLRERMAG